MHREMHLRQQLAEPVSSEGYEAIRKLWIEHSKAELDRDVDGLVATLVPDCCYEIIPTGQRWTGLEGARRFTRVSSTPSPTPKYSPPTS